MTANLTVHVSQIRIRLEDTRVNVCPGITAPTATSAITVGPITVITTPPASALIINIYASVIRIIQVLYDTHAN